MCACVVCYIVFEGGKERCVKCPGTYCTWTLDLANCGANPAISALPQVNLQSEEEQKKRRKKARKQMSLQETSEPQAYPVTTSLPRQNTIGERDRETGRDVLY